MSTHGGDNLDRLARERRLGVGAEGDDARDEDGRGHVAGVASALATLGADEVDAGVEGFLRGVRRTSNASLLALTCLGWPIMFMTGIFALCRRSTT